MALANPLVDFDDLLLVKRTPAWFTVSPGSRTYTHMCDQYYGWFSRPGGGLYLLKDFKTDQPVLRCLTEDFAPGNWADLTIFEQDLSTTPARQWPAVGVEMTLIDGELVYCKKLNQK